MCTAFVIHIQTKLEVKGFSWFINPLNAELNPICHLLALLGKGKGKSVPLQAWSGPESFTKLKFPDFMTTVQDGGKVVSLSHRPPLPP